MKIIQVGSGGWGQGWLEYIQNTPGCELVGLVSRGGSNLEAAQKRWNLSPGQCFSDFSQALALEADLVIITLPHKWHLTYARQAIEAGKNVLIEKPLCDVWEDALAFQAFAKGRRERVWVSQNYRFRPQLWQLKASLDAEHLGPLAWLDLEFRFGRTTGTAEHLWHKEGWRASQTNLMCIEYAIHHMDMLRFLTGSNIESVSCMGWAPEWSDCEDIDCLFAQLTFANGVRGTYSGHCRSIGGETGFQGNWRIQTSKGFTVWEYDNAPRVSSADDANACLAEEYVFPGLDRGGILVEMQRALCGEKTAVPTLEDNLYSLAPCFALLRSAQENRTVRIDEFL